MEMRAKKEGRVRNPRKGLGGRKGKLPHPALQKTSSQGLGLASIPHLQLGPAPQKHQCCKHRSWPSPPGAALGGALVGKGVGGVGRGGREEERKKPHIVIAILKRNSRQE